MITRLCRTGEKAGNCLTGWGGRVVMWGAGTGADYPQSTEQEAAFDIVISNLEDIFGFLKL